MLKIWQRIAINPNRLQILTNGQVSDAALAGRKRVRHAAHRMKEESQWIHSSS